MKRDLEMVATVDEVSQMQIVREALKEYFGTLDMKWYREELTTFEPEAELEEGESIEESDEETET
jgi:hypothetical protein